MSRLLNQSTTCCPVDSVVGFCFAYGSLLVSLKKSNLNSWNHTLNGGPHQSFSLLYVEWLILKEPLHSFVATYALVMNVSWQTKTLKTMKVASGQKD